MTEEEKLGVTDVAWMGEKMKWDLPIRKRKARVQVGHPKVPIPVTDAKRLAWYDKVWKRHLLKLRTEGRIRKVLHWEIER